VVGIAALFCGLIAGLFALVAPVGLGIDLLTPFLKLWGASPGQQLLGTIAWYAPVAAAILGGLLAFVAPGPGALLLLGAGLGWIGFGVFDLALLRIELLVPGIASIAGSLLAFFAGELELRRRRAARRNRRDTLRDGAPPPDRSMSSRASGMSRDAGRTDDEDRAREAAFSMDPLTVTRDEAPPRPSREIPLTLEDVVPADPEPREQRRRGPETIWPETPAARRSMFERESPPDLQPRRSLFDRPATRVERPAADRRDRTTARREREPRPDNNRDRDRDFRDRDQRDYYDDEPAPRRNLFVWFVAANVLVLVVIAVVVGYMIVDRSSAPAAGTVAVAEATMPAAATPVPAITVQTPAVTDANAADTDRLTPNVWPELALPGTPAANQPTLPMAPTDTPVAATVGPAAATVAEAVPAAQSPAAGTFADPFAYCQAVKTVDYVDSRYAGPRFTADIADALRVPMESAPDRVSWRCVDGVIYACASFDWPVCAMTPTAQEMVDYCQRNPGVTRLLAPNGTWSCEGNKPRIPDGASWPVDARGFFPNAWIPVLPPQRPTG
jgi:hypothetical protein